MPIDDRLWRNFLREAGLNEEVLASRDGVQGVSIWRHSCVGVTRWLMRQ